MKYDLTVFFLLAQCALIANPKSPAVVAGDARFEIRSQDVLEIIAADRSVIDWVDFSIEAAEITRFIQPDASCAVLNRVVMNNPSRLLGKLESNGQVLLINPNGILVGKEAQINTSSFIASSLDLNKEVFLKKGSLAFKGNSKAPIRNEGEIFAVQGDAVLIGWNVSNNGQIFAQNGTAALLASDQVCFQPNPNAWISIETPSILLNKEIPNSFSRATHAGTLVSNFGDRGGQGVIWGQEVILSSDSITEASGLRGGGNLFIGGSDHNRSLLMPDARSTIVEKGAFLRANALESGSGGVIFLTGANSLTALGELQAQGGSLGGDGGFVEYTTYGFLDFNGHISTLAPNGKNGTLVIDPADVNIGAASNGTWNNACPTGFIGNPAAVQILNTDLVTALGGCNVVIDTSTSTGAGAGNILVSAPVSWPNPTSLTLRTATGNITFNQSVQNTAPGAGGDVILIAPTVGTITLDTAAAGANVFVGSQNGTTSIGDISAANCLRTHPNVVINSTSSLAAFLGFNCTGGLTATGPIQATTNDLTITSSSSTPVANDSSAGIGHGVQVSQVPSSTMSTTAAATITVNSTGNILLRATGPAAQASQAAIGHGAALARGPGSLQGDICVTCDHDITLTYGNTVGLFGSRIGHGCLSFLGAISTFTAISGNVSVHAGGSITLHYTNGCDTSIGHYTNPNIRPITMAGNIFVNAPGLTSDLNMIPLPGGNMGFCNNFIGHANFSFTSSTTTQCNILISVGRDLTMRTNNQSGVGFISRNGIGTPFRNPNVPGIVSISVGRNLTMESTVTTGATAGWGYIGHESGTAGGSTYIAVAGNATLGNTIANSTYIHRIQSPGDVNFSVRGNLTVRGSDSLALPPMFSFISTNLTAPTAMVVPPPPPPLTPGTGTTRIWVGGNITNNNSANPIPTGRAFLFGQVADPSNNVSASLDIRAAGALQMPVTSTGFGFATDTGSAFIGGNASFDPIDPNGVLWTSNGIQLTSVADQPIPLIVSPQTVCPFCNANSNSIGNSPTVPFSAAGIIRPNFGIRTMTGPITLSSSTPTRPANSLASNAVTPPLVPIGLCLTCTESNDVILGTGPGEINIATISGDITVSVFRDITINENITTSGNIDIEACRDLLFNTPNTISTTGGGSIYLASGHDLAITGTVASDSGSICLFAQNDINLANGVFSMSGSISAISGNNITVSNLVTTTGPILLLADQNISLSDPGSIISTGSSVTLIVDNAHPAAPLPANISLLGIFQMGAGTTISSGTGWPLRIFTALQGLNQIDPTAVLNGSPYGQGTLYQDTSTEVWCLYAPIISRCSTASDQGDLVQLNTGCGSFPFFSMGMPYTISYKDCLQQTTSQAQIIVTQFNVELHPYNEFPGWMERFWVMYSSTDALSSKSSLEVLSDEPYYFRRRHFNILNQPKSWTVYSQPQ